MFPRQRQRTGFTLIELLVVIAVVGLLVALVIPAVQAARRAARRTHCLSNQRQLALAVLQYHGAREAFPLSSNGNFWSWITAILPHMEETGLYERFDFQKFAFPPEDNEPLVGTVLPMLHCAEDASSDAVSPYLEGHAFAYTNYLGVAGSEGGIGLPEYQGNGIFPGLPPRHDRPQVALRHVTDGASKTLMIGERPVVAYYNQTYGDWGWWAAGAGLHWLPRGRGDNVLDSSWGLRPGTPSVGSIDDVFHWWSHHTGGAQFALADGSARLLSYDTDHEVLLGLSTRNGNESR
jgi:prepilin-type N-terminal cleavage/methylation domain-containing protein